VKENEQNSELFLYPPGSKIKFMRWAWR